MDLKKIQQCVSVFVHKFMASVLNYTKNAAIKHNNDIWTLINFAI